MFKFEDCLSYLTSKNAKEMASILDKRLSVIGITRVQWMAMYYIYDHPDITQKELAELLGTKEPTVVRLLDRMEKDKLVKRIHRDRRSNLLELTENGRNLYLQGMQIAEKFKDDAMRDIPEEYMDYFVWILDKMVENTK